MSQNGKAGFELSCYDAELCYDRRTDTFGAWYWNKLLCFIPLIHFLRRIVERKHFIFLLSISSPSLSLSLSLSLSIYLYIYISIYLIMFCVHPLQRQRLCVKEWYVNFVKDTSGIYIYIYIYLIMFCVHPLQRQRYVCEGVICELCQRHLWRQNDIILHGAIGERRTYLTISFFLIISLCILSLSLAQYLSLFLSLRRQSPVLHVFHSVASHFCLFRSPSLSLPETSIPSLSLSPHLRAICQWLCLLVCQSVSLSLCLSILIFISLSIHLSSY